MKRPVIGIITFLLLLFPALSDAQTMNTEPITSSRCNQFTFDASGSFDPDNDVIFFAWDFGDGTTSSESVVEHSFENSGDYFVNLTVKDQTGLRSSLSQLIRVNIPPFASFHSPSRACSNQKINFDGTQSRDDKGNRLKYNWNFGDGSTVKGQQSVEKIYTSGGTYKVILVVDDSGPVCSEASVSRMIYINEPPFADAGKDKIVKCVLDESEMFVKFDASNSYDKNNDRLKFDWDFGDNQTDEGKVVTHRFDKVGSYEVKLTVNDQSQLTCDASVDFVSVKLAKSAEVDAGEDLTACIGEDIRYNGETSLKGKKTVKWDFGDGQSADGLDAVHQYQKPGSYQSVLTVEDLKNNLCPAATDMRIVTINTMPTVSMNKPADICLGEKLFFDATAFDGDGDNLEYYWSFGDGTITKGRSKASHEYKQGGRYRVSLVIDDGRKTACSTATANVLVKVNTAPIVDPGENIACCSGEMTEFNASSSTDSDGDELSFYWDLGDGTKREGAIVKHTYRKNGAYNVVLTVDDNASLSCSRSTISFVAQIRSKPVPVLEVR